MRRWLVLLCVLLLTCAACGGDGSSGAPSETVGTLAYVVTECRETAAGFVERQEVRIRRGDHDAVTVYHTPGIGPLTGVGGLCRALTVPRTGRLSTMREAIQAVAVSPDGSLVVFEASDDFSVFPPLPLHLAPEEKGIFVVRADGSGLHRLGAASQEPFSVLHTPGPVVVALGGIVFSPNGRRLALVDKGPDSAGNDASQIVLLDVASGARMQITQLPPAAAPPGYAANTPSILGFGFLDDETIAFGTYADADGSNPDGAPAAFSIKTDGSALKPLAAPVALPGSQILPIFAITGNRLVAASLIVPGTPANDAVPGSNAIQEIFLFDNANLLQLTNFRRDDTGLAGVLLGVDRERVYLTASANPAALGDGNPTENCQIFSIDRIGSGLRQLTSLSEAPHSSSGCMVNRGPGCAPQLLAQDPLTQQLIFYSNCNPLGTNPDGGQIFAMNSDGTALVQLTDARGLVTEPDGTVLGELPGPEAYGPHQ
jgi:hypothetical protein